MRRWERLERWLAKPELPWRAALLAEVSFGL
jgi:hypothetical protein